MAEVSNQLAPLDPVWTRLCEEASEITSREPLLAGLVYSGILHHESLEKALAFRFSIKMASLEMSEQLLRETADEALNDDPGIGRSARADIIAVFDRDPACQTFYQPLLFFKGFQALQCYRIGRWLWENDRKDLAYFIQTGILPVRPFISHCCFSRVSKHCNVIELAGGCGKMIARIWPISFR